MRLTIEKLSNGVKIELAKEGSKPEFAILQESEIRSLIAVLEGALRVKTFKFSIDL